MRLLIGDTANSLRSALDYMVGQLAHLDSGARKRGTQFPIEDTPEGFKRRKKDYLKGVSDVHIAAIEELQPYKGCEWTYLLRRISNPDKHDYPAIVAHDYLVSWEAVVDSADSDSTNLRVKVKIQPVLRIALSDGTSIVETLELLQSQVTQTLGAFNPEF